jgi:hypothetical protein
MAKIDTLPSQIAGTEVHSSLPVGILGDGYLGADSILKILGAEDTFTPPPNDPGLIAFEAAGEEDGRVAISAPREPMAPLGILVSGSPLQNRALASAALLDPDQEIARALRAQDVSARLALVKRLAEDLARLHSSGHTHRFVTPWTVVLAGDSPRLIDGGIAPSPDWTPCTPTR